MTVLSRLHMYQTARLVLNVEEGMTDEEDLEFLWKLLLMLGVERTDIDTLLRGEWSSDRIAAAIWNESQ